MKMFDRIKARFPRIIPTVIALSAVTSLAGAAAYQQLAEDDCCAVGAPCCHPGAACCMKHKHQ